MELTIAAKLNKPCEKTQKSKAQGTSERAERQPSELERFFERGRDRIGQEVSGCSEIKLSLTKLPCDSFWKGSAIFQFYLVDRIRKGTTLR